MNERCIVMKFGGSSLADSNQFRKVRDIIYSRSRNNRKCFVVASAPGKRNFSDIKVTDLLYSCYNLAFSKKDFTETLSLVYDRFNSIITELEIDFDLKSEIETIRKNLETKPSKAYMASRGEYLNSKILAKYMNFDFVDPATCVCFNKDGILDSQKTETAVRNVLSDLTNAVVAGFYGSSETGEIVTFSRGGSDVTGSVVAGAVKASVYENWTDVSGMLSADPRIVENPKPIDVISYRELRELSYMGASVLHEDAVFPVRKAGIPINIRNTNRPDDNGTMIVPHVAKEESKRIVTGIAGKKGFSTLLVEKALMNNEVGFAAKLLEIIASHGVSFEHIPSGIDTMSAIVETQAFRQSKSEIIEEIKERLQPDTVIVESGLVLIAVVGLGMASTKGVAARVFGSLSDAGVNIRMIDQGSSELNIIVGVDESDYETAVRAIYAAFF